MSWAHLSLAVTRGTQLEGAAVPGAPQDRAADRGRALIRRKLIPPVLGDAVVRRPRLTDLVCDDLAGSKVVTVCAAAGAGKSTAVAGALDDIGRPLAWLTLDGTEAAAGRLRHYLEAAGRPHAPEAEGAATEALAAGLAWGQASGLTAESLHGSGVWLA